MAEVYTPQEVANARKLDVHVVLAAIRAGELAAVNWARLDAGAPDGKSALQPWLISSAADLPHPPHRGNVAVG